MHLQMAKRRITDIARERGLDPNEVASRLAEAGVAIRGDTVDEAAAARALAGSRPVARTASPTATARPAARVAAPPPSHPQALRPPAPEQRPRQPENRQARPGGPRP